MDAEVPAPPDPARSPAARRARLRAILQVALGMVGVAALVGLIRHVGPGPLIEILRRAAPFLPLLLALEMGRVGCDTLATFTLCPPGRVPLRALVRTHIVAYPVASLMPAGRTTAEAVKAALLSSYLGVPRAAAIGAANQSMSLVAAGLLSICAATAAAALTGASPLTFGVALHAVIAISLGLTVAFTARGRTLGGWIARRFARAGQATAAFQEAAREHPVVPPRTLTAFFLSRVLQTTQYAVLLAAVGGATGPGRALVAHGVNAIGAALGDLIPAQVGATDSAFTFAAPWLGLATTAAIAISVLVHSVQVSGSLVGIAVAFVWRQQPPPSPPPGAGEPPPSEAKPAP